MLCFTTEATLGGRDGRWCQMAGAAVVGYAWGGPPMGMQLQIARHLTRVGSKWHWVAGCVGKCNCRLLGARLKAVGLRWHWVGGSGAMLLLGTALADC